MNYNFFPSAILGHMPLEVGRQPRHHSAAQEPWAQVSDSSLCAVAPTILLAFLARALPRLATARRKSRHRLRPAAPKTLRGLRLPAGAPIEGRCAARSKVAKRLRVPLARGQLHTPCRSRAGRLPQARSSRSTARRSSAPSLSARHGAFRNRTGEPAAASRPTRSPGEWASGRWHRTRRTQCRR